MSYLDYKLEKPKSKSPANLSSYINTYISSYIDNYLNNEEGAHEEKIRHEKSRFNYFGTYDDSFFQEDEISKIKNSRKFIIPVESTKTNNQYKPVEKEEKYRFKTSYYNKLIADESRTSTPTLAESDNYSSTDNTNRNSEKTLTPQDGERDSSFEEYYTPHEEIVYYHERDTDIYSKESNVGADEYSDEYINQNDDYRRRTERPRGLFRDKVFYEKSLNRKNDNYNDRDQYNDDRDDYYRRERDDHYSDKDYKDDYSRRDRFDSRHDYRESKDYRNSKDYSERDDYKRRDDYYDEEEYRGRDRRESYKNSYRDYPRDNNSVAGSVGRSPSYRGSIRDSQSIADSVTTIARIPRNASLTNRLRGNSPARSVTSVQYIQSPTLSASTLTLQKANSVRSKQVYPEESPKRISFFNHPFKFIKKLTGSDKNSKTKKDTNENAIPIQRTPSVQSSVRNSFQSVTSSVVSSAVNQTNSLRYQNPIQSPIQYSVQSQLQYSNSPTSIRIKSPIQQPLRPQSQAQQPIRPQSPIQHLIRPQSPTHRPQSPVQIHRPQNTVPIQSSILNQSPIQSSSSIRIAAGTASKITSPLERSNSYSTPTTTSHIQSSDRKYSTIDRVQKTEPIEKRLDYFGIYNKNDEKELVEEHSDDTITSSLVKRNNSVTKPINNMINYLKRTKSTGERTKSSDASTEVNETVDPGNVNEVIPNPVTGLVRNNSKGSRTSKTSKTDSIRNPSPVHTNSILSTASPIVLTPIMATTDANSASPILTTVNTIQGNQLVASPSLKNVKINNQIGSPTILLTPVITTGADEKTTTQCYSPIPVLISNLPIQTTTPAAATTTTTTDTKSIKTKVNTDNLINFDNKRKNQTQNTVPRHSGVDKIGKCLTFHKCGYDKKRFNNDRSISDIDKLNSPNISMSSANLNLSNNNISYLRNSKPKQVKKNYNNNDTILPNTPSIVMDEFSDSDSSHSEDHKDYKIYNFNYDNGSESSSLHLSLGSKNNGKDYLSRSHSRSTRSTVGPNHRSQSRGRSQSSRHRSISRGRLSQRRRSLSYGYNSSRSRGRSLRSRRSRSLSRGRGRHYQHVKNYKEIYNHDEIPYQHYHDENRDKELTYNKDYNDHEYLEQGSRDEDYHKHDYRDSHDREYNERKYHDSEYRRDSEYNDRDNEYRRDSEYRDSEYRDSEYRDSEYRDSEYRDSEYRDSEYRDSEYRRDSEYNDRDSRRDSEYHDRDSRRDSEYHDRDSRRDSEYHDRDSEHRRDSEYYDRDSEYRRDSEYYDRDSRRDSEYHDRDSRRDSEYHDRDSEYRDSQYYDREYSDRYYNESTYNTTSNYYDNTTTSNIYTRPYAHNKSLYSDLNESSDYNDTRMYGNTTTMESSRKYQSYTTADDDLYENTEANTEELLSAHYEDINSVIDNYDKSNN